MRFLVLVFYTDQRYIGQIMRLLSVFDFVLEFADLFKYFNIRWWLSWWEDSFPSTESTPSETPHWLSQREFRLSVNWVNAEWWFLCKCWCLLRWLRWHGVSLHVDSVVMESHSVLTQLMGSFTPLNSVYGRWIKPKQAYKTSSGAFKGIGFL